MSRNEMVTQRGLSGSELAEIIKKDTAFILANDGMFTNSVAYGRVSYELRLTVHVDNALVPTHVSVVHPFAVSKQQLAANPELAALEMNVPLDDTTEDDIILGVEVERSIQSPNAARIEHDLPIQVKVTVDGQKTLKDITYTGDKPTPESSGNSSVISDVSEEVAKKLKSNKGAKR